jgi:hypothetical protein
VISLVSFLLLISVSAEAAQLGHITSQVNFRERPSRSADAIGVLSAGSEIRVLKEAAGNWYQIIHAGRSGFVHKSYVRLDQHQNSRGRSEAKRQPTPILLGIILAAIGIILMASVLAPDLLLRAATLGVAFVSVVVFDLFFQLGLLYSLFLVSFGLLALVIFFKRRKKDRAVPPDQISPKKAA